MGLMDVVGTLKSKAEGLEEAAKLAATNGLDQWQKAMTILETFGFTVGRFTVAMGVVPEIHASISGSVANNREDGLKQIIAAHAGETLLVTMLEALIFAKHLWEHVELKLTSATLNVTLGLPPKVTVELH